MRIILSLTILIANLQGTPYGLSYDDYDDYYNYDVNDNNIDNIVMIPQFITQPLNMIVNSGKTAKLPCIVDRLEGFVLLWKKNEQIISVGHQLLDKHISNYHIEPVKNGNYLMISSVDVADEDKYTCAVSTIKREEISHALRVRIEPKIETSPRELVTIQEGDSLLLQCKVLAGSPTPTIRWRKCGGKVLTEQEVFSVDIVERNIGGCYSCEADNGFSITPVSSQLSVIVQYAPEVTIDKLGDSKDNITVVCQVKSQPSPSVVFYRDSKIGDRVVLYSDHEVEDDSDVVVTHDSSTDTTLFKLQLENGDVTQFGDYTCSADNILGHASQSVKVSGEILP